MIKHSNNKVLQSINAPIRQFALASRCVDVFCRPDGSYGFEEYRRDPEDPSGWYAIGGFGDAVYDSEARALEDARTKIKWLSVAS